MQVPALGFRHGAVGPLDRLLAGKIHVIISLLTPNLLPIHQHGTRPLHALPHLDVEQGDPDGRSPDARSTGSPIGADLDLVDDEDLVEGEGGDEGPEDGDGGADDGDVDFEDGEDVDAGGRVGGVELGECAGALEAEGDDARDAEGYDAVSELVVYFRCG